MKKTTKKKTAAKKKLGGGLGKAQRKRYSRAANIAKDIKR